jgi:hypothetical protein
MRTIRPIRLPIFSLRLVLEIAFIPGSKCVGIPLERSRIDVEVCSFVVATGTGA